MTLEGQTRSVGSYSSTLHVWPARFWSRTQKTAYIAESKLKAAETLQCWLSHSLAAGNAIANGEAPATGKHARSLTLLCIIGTLQEEAELAGMTLNQSPLNDVLSIVIRWEDGEAISRGNLEATFRIMELETNRLIRQTVAHAQSARDGDTPAVPIVRVTKPGDIPAGPLGGNDRSESELPPVVCLQVELATFMRKSKNTTKLGDKLKAQGILSKVIAPSTPRGPWKFWFADRRQHEKALRDISITSTDRPLK